MRGEQGLSAIGKVADLVPTSPIMDVGGNGVINGDGFEVVGRMQLDHGLGPWDEWYIHFPSVGQWGWLAQAQGKFYLTFLENVAQVPQWSQLQAGQQVGLAPNAIQWTVTERGTSRLLSAEGELPYPFVPNEQGTFVDLAGPNGAFASIDYGDGRDAPHVFAGAQINPQAIEIHRKGGLEGAPIQKVQAKKVGCPSCGGPIDIRAPKTSQRAVCQFCNTLLDCSQGNLAILKKLSQPAMESPIPLGSKGNFGGEDVVVIGFLRRSTQFDGVYYRWSEYLLYAENGGYRWLLEDNGHWNYLRDASAGDMEATATHIKYKGRRYSAFAQSEATVDYVVGEFYWRVETGQRSLLTDYVAPPYVLGREVSQAATGSEVVWTHGEYTEPKSIWKHLGLAGKPPPQRGVSPAQPNPYGLSVPFFSAVAATLLMVIAGYVLGAVRGNDVLLSQDLQVPATQATRVTHESKRFHVDGPTPLRIRLETNAINQWVGVSFSLKDVKTQKTQKALIDVGSYKNKPSDRVRTGYLSSVPSGDYTLSTTPEWEANTSIPALSVLVNAPRAKLTVTEGKRSAGCLCCSVFLVWIPLFIAMIRRSGFERKRNLNKTF